MNPTAIGKEAEQAAIEHLVRLGYEIVDHNWKTPRCEIDIIARKASVMHFVEVKYRQSNRQGSGLDYITAPKLRRMSFAADVWRQCHGWSGDINLAAIEVFAPGFVIGEFIESIEA